MWDFKKLPQSEYPEVLKQWENQNFIELLKIYNRYKIPPTNLTACCAWAAIKIWSEYAIREHIEPTLRNNPGEILQQDSTSEGGTV